MTNVEPLNYPVGCSMQGTAIRYNYDTRTRRQACTGSGYGYCSHYTVTGKECNRNNGYNRCVSRNTNTFDPIIESCTSCERGKYQDETGRIDWKEGISTEPWSGILTTPITLPEPCKNCPVDIRQVAQALPLKEGNMCQAGYQKNQPLPLHITLLNRKCQMEKHLS